MAIVVVFDKPCVGKSRQSGLHDGQFADARVIVGELRLPHLAEARPPRALAGAHLPAATGLVQQRFAKAAREIAVECGDRGIDEQPGLQLQKLEIVINLPCKLMITRAFAELVYLRVEEQTSELQSLMRTSYAV